MHPAGQEQNRPPTKDDSARGHMVDFLDKTSFAAVVHIFRAKSIARKFIWVLLSVCLSGWMFLQCFWLVQRYYQYPVAVDVNLKFASALEFPSVTLCNLNPIRIESIYGTKYEKAFEAYEDSMYDDALFQGAMQSWMDTYEPRPPKEKQPPASDEPTTTFAWATLGTEVQWTTLATTAPPSPPPLRRKRNVGHETLHSEVDAQLPSHSTDENEERLTEVLSRHKQSVGNAVKKRRTEGNQDRLSNKPEPDLVKSRRKRDTLETNLDTYFDAIGNTNDLNYSNLILESEFNRWEMLDGTNEEEFYDKTANDVAANEVFVSIAQSIRPAKLEQIGHQKEDFIMACQFQGKPCAPKNFTTFQNYKYGNCFTFNTGTNNGNATTDVLKTNRPGPMYGLVVELFIEQDEYISALAPDAGARVVIHPSGIMPFPEDEGFKISPGVATSVGLKKHVIQRLTPPHGACGGEWNTSTLYSQRFGVNYSKEACLKSCLQAAINDACQCSSIEYPIIHGATVCKNGNNDTAKCKNAVQLDYSTSMLGCDDACPIPCMETSYEMSVSTTLWPARKYEEKLRQKLMRTSSKAMRVAYLQDSIKEDVAKLEVYFSELVYEIVAQKEAYQSQNLISDLGGQLGLWLGLSILAFGELLELIMSLCLISFAKMKSKRRVTDIPEKM